MASAKRGSRANLPRKKPPEDRRGPLDKAKAWEVDWQQVSGVFTSARRIENPSFVYFIGEPDDGPVKIGVAKCPIARLRGMQTGNPRRLKVERALIGDRELEKLLHEFWEDLIIPTPASKLRPDSLPLTEWFQPEIRERLYPIIADAADEQAFFISEAEGAVDLAELERIVRRAHGNHGFVPHIKHDDVRFLAPVMGEVYVRRPSRI